MPLALIAVNKNVDYLNPLSKEIRESWHRRQGEKIHKHERRYRGNKNKG